MLSKPHAYLYSRLQQNAVCVQSALETKDYNALPALMDEQHSVVQQLVVAGPCNDSSLLSLLTETRNCITGMTPVIQKYRDELAGQFKTNATRIKLNKAYGR